MYLLKKTNLCEILKQVITLMEAQANLNNVSILLKETAKGLLMFRLMQIS